MERNEGIQGFVLTIAACLAFSSAGCSVQQTGSPVETEISFSCGMPECRSADPDEYRISDISLMVFDGNGEAEECLYLEDGRGRCSVRLNAGNTYTFCACANFGYQVYADNIEELDDIRYHLAYPDEYHEGIPMYARQDVKIGKDSRGIVIMLERLMAKISLRMDRSRLSDGVELLVRSVQIGNCPRSVSVFTENRVRDEDDRFPAGFSRYGFETDNLNRTSESGLSESVSLYMLENMQGVLGEEIHKDSDKVFDKDSYRSTVCSYVEMEMEYMSDTFESGEKGLTYRFYLGEGLNDLNIERNCHYHITVAPGDDGLSEDGWRVDKSGLTYSGPVNFKPHPSEYIVGNIGDKIHIWCEFLPVSAPFDIGIEYMEDDRTEGIYDYVIDEDGHGATLTLTGPGRGLIYMSAGPPVNDEALFIIEVNLPEGPTSISRYGIQDMKPAAQECRQRRGFLRHRPPPVPGL